MLRKIVAGIIALMLSLSTIAFAQVSVNSIDKKTQYIDCHIPQISGMDNQVNQKAVNKYLYNQIQGDLTEFQKTVVEYQADAGNAANQKFSFGSSYSVKYFRSFIISVVQSEYWYTGGAHGMAQLKAANINTVSGQIYTLEQIFRKNSDWLNVLNKNIASQIEGMKEADGYDFKSISKYDQFYFIEEGLVIYFQPYEIGPWAIGMPKFVIPWLQIADVIRTDLPLY